MTPQRWADVLLPPPAPAPAYPAAAPASSDTTPTTVPAGAPCAPAPSDTTPASSADPAPVPAPPAGAPGERSHRVVGSPFGDLTLVATGGVLSGLYMDVQRHKPDAAMFGPRDGAVLADVARQLDEWFAGERTEFDVPIVFHGTPFQQRVWRALLAIPYGVTWTYGQLAARLGDPRASRAVGLANGKNPISIIVPCHRVIGSTGSLTGYGGGLDRKRRLLEFEAGVLPLG